MKSFVMTKTVMKNLLEGPATLMYPKKQRIFVPMSRGKVEVNINECIFCGMCDRRCPTDAIVGHEGSKGMADRPPQVLHLRSLCRDLSDKMPPHG